VVLALWRSAAAADASNFAIPLPRSSDSAYRQVLLLGTTGGGKTTLVRQLIGTDPHTERFPSTSTARTTVSDMEILLSPGLFRAAVTFLPRDEIRDYVEESMSAAACKEKAEPHSAGSTGAESERRGLVLKLYESKKFVAVARPIEPY